MPIVHLQINIGRVFAAPGRRRIHVPDPLQVGGLRAGAAGGKEQIAAKLEIERRQCRIVGPGLDGVDAFVDRLGRGGGPAEIELHAVHPFPEIINMAG